MKFPLQVYLDNARGWPTIFQPQLYWVLAPPEWMRWCYPYIATKIHKKWLPSLYSHFGVKSAKKNSLEFHGNFMFVECWSIINVLCNNLSIADVCEFSLCMHIRSLLKCVTHAHFYFIACILHSFCYACPWTLVYKCISFKWTTLRSDALEACF